MASVRISKILKAPLPSSSVKGEGPKSNPYKLFILPPLSRPSPNMPQTTPAHMLPLGYLLCLSVPPVPPSRDIPGQTLFFPQPTSPLCLSLCPTIISIFGNNELCPSFLSLSRLEVPPGQPGTTASYSCLFVNREGIQPGAAKQTPLAVSSRMLLHLRAFAHAVLTA